jgi:hypothetical protein
MTPAKNPRGWKWFFALLALLTLSSTVGLIWYNLSQQLRPEQFEAARKLWSERGPTSYHLAFKESFSSPADGQTSSNDYAVTVRDGKVVAVIVNGIPKTERLQYHDMNGIFNEIERFFELDEKEKRRVFRRAIFDEHTGAVRWFVRRVMASRERQEITVESLEAR